MAFFKRLALLLATATVVTSEPQSPSNTYLPPDQGYQYPRPTVPFPSPGPSAPGPSPSYPRPQPPTYRPSPTPLRPSPTPTYGPPPTGPQRPGPTYGPPPTGPQGPSRPPPYDGGALFGDEQHHHDHHEPGMPFDFNYAVKDDYYGTDYAHNAISDGDVVKGEYRVKLPDGRTQVVRYTADWKTGYHADVQYEGQAVYPDSNRPGGGFGGGGAPSGSYGPPGPSSPGY